MHKVHTNIWAYRICTSKVYAVAYCLLLFVVDTRDATICGCILNCDCVRFTAAAHTARAREHIISNNNKQKQLGASRRGHTTLLLYYIARAIECAARTDGMYLRLCMRACARSFLSCDYFSLCSDRFYAVWWCLRSFKISSHWRILFERKYDFDLVCFSPRKRLMMDYLLMVRYFWICANFSINLCRYRGVPEEYKKTGKMGAHGIKHENEFILLRKLMATKKENVISIHNCGESPFM